MFAAPVMFGRFRYTAPYFCAQVMHESFKRIMHIVFGSLKNNQLYITTSCLCGFSHILLSNICPVSSSLVQEAETDTHHTYLHTQLRMRIDIQYYIRIHMHIGILLRVFLIICDFQRAFGRPCVMAVLEQLCPYCFWRSYSIFAGRHDELHTAAPVWQCLHIHGSSSHALDVFLSIVSYLFHSQCKCRSTVVQNENVTKDYMLNLSLAVWSCSYPEGAHF
jgi:hypothetical protein